MNGDRAAFPRIHPFVVIEGVDGTGKSTAVAGLARALGATVYKSPGGPFADARPVVDRGLDGLSRYFFFRAAVQYDSARIAELLANGPVVCDRYLDSARVCHIARDPSVATLRDAHLVLRPSATFVLTARPQVIARRLSEREVLGHEERDLDFILRCDAGFRALGHPVIDTSDADPARVVARMLELLAASTRPNFPSTHVLQPEPT